MNDDHVLLDRSMSPDHGAVREVRREVAAAMRVAGAPDELVGDAELVSSEILTNAVDRRPGADVRILLRSHPPEVTLTVSNSGTADQLPPVHTWAGLTQAADARGRGLPIVAALAERIQVVDHDGWTSVSCGWTIPTDRR
ncbi:MAG: ATP-binding protein [Actinomycetota bacterium]